MRRSDRRTRSLRARLIVVFAVVSVGGAVGFGVQAASAHNGGWRHRPHPYPTPSATASPGDPSATPTGSPSPSGTDPSGTGTDPSGTASGSAAPTDTAAPSDTASATATGSDTAPPTSPPAVDPADNGPVAEDFVDITTVQPVARTVRPIRAGSFGSFVSNCGKNENGHHNSANFIVAPGNNNGAHHTHDYVGNLSTDGNSTDDSLAAAGTTCGQDDRSAYYWPVLRQLGQQAPDAGAAGGGADGNKGTILEPASVTLQFRGNARSKVAAMPRFLKVITGDAKAFVNGPANARAQWTCSGSGDRRTTQYPLCPQGQAVVRILDFPSCWDGTNTDSANHRTHIAFTQPDGSCPTGTKAVPRLRFVLQYRDVPAGPSFAVDSFPEQLHKPITDHGDFENVMPDDLMNKVVTCINTNRRC